MVGYKLELGQLIMKLYEICIINVKIINLQNGEKIFVIG
jgi:hypothetical protein